MPINGEGVVKTSFALEFYNQRVSNGCKVLNEKSLRGGIVGWESERNIRNMITDKPTIFDFLD